MSVEPAYDRLGHLLAEQTPAFNGIDYVEITTADQTQLRIHFLNGVGVKGTFTASPPVTICGPGALGSVAVQAIDESQAWSTDNDGRPLLNVSLAAAGDSATYSLTIYSSVLDPYFDTVQFRFGAGSSGQLDCQTPAPPCPAPSAGAAPINYLAKDFSSFKQALSDFSALRYPQWVERSEADLGVVLMEALSAIADELSYLQDRVAAEATLGTATQRVSLMHHARLVDYDPSPAIAAITTLQVDVADGVTVLGSGLRCSAVGADGVPVPFELGSVLTDQSAGQLLPTSYAVDPAWNAGPVNARNLLAYWWDVKRQCLPAGSTRIWVFGHGYGFGSGQQLLIDTSDPDGVDPPVREIVTIGVATETVDPVFDDPQTHDPIALTRIDLQSPTQLDHDLMRTHLAGNLLPAMQGARMSETFTVPGDVVVRLAANSTPQDPRPEYRYTLQASQISWLPDAFTAYLPALAAPAGPSLAAGSAGGSLSTGQYAYRVTAVTANGETTASSAATVQVTGPAGSVTLTWDAAAAASRYNVYRQDPGAATAGRIATAGPFAAGQQATYLDTGITSPDLAEPPPTVNTTAGPGPSTQNADLNADVAAVPQIALTSANPTATWQWERWLLGSGAADTVFTLTPESYVPVGAQGADVWFDYDGEGTTIRFGDGTFGLTPTESTKFTTTYLAGGGSVGNVPADTIVHVDPNDPQAALVVAVSNPFAATGGADEETPQQIRDRAPQAFQANPLRAVLASDYVAAARSLPWVMQAGTSFRWTGSWLTVFTTADPVATETLTVEQLEELSDLLNRRRLAGYESYALAPVYVSIDLEIAVVAQPTALAASVQAAIVQSLSPGVLADGSRGFFDHQRWSFGQPLEASALLAAIQRVPGVLGVTSVSYRERGLQPDFLVLPETVSVPAGQILRMDNDPSNPDNGSLLVTVGESQ